MKLLAHLVLLCLMVLTTGCASLFSDMEPPKVSIESVKILPTEGFGPRFEIKLRVINPNKKALDIAGISYAIDILDRELVSGVTNEVPLISGYGEDVITLNAGVNMYQFFRLLAGLGKTESDNLGYRFSAKIDFNGFVPTQRIEETGVFDLK